MASNLDTLAADIQSYIVAPMAAFGLAGFIFDIEGESVAQISAEITDHYSEDNKAIQDHIARKPKSITLKGYVGEVVFKPNESILGTIQNVAQKLVSVASYLPQISAAASEAQQAFSSSAGIGSLSLSSVSDDYSLVKNLLGSFGETANQQNAYKYFVSLWQQGTLMGVQTPWEFMPNMVIESITAIQTEGTKYITDFAVKYKQLRFAQTQTAAYNASAYLDLTPQQQVAADVAAESPSPSIQGDASIQAQDPVSIGNVEGQALSVSQKAVVFKQLGYSTKSLPPALP